MKFAQSRRRIIALGIAGALAIGAVGVVSAQAAQGEGRGGIEQRAMKGALKNLSEISGLAPEVFRQGLKDGKSINQVLIENGKNPAEVQAAVLDAIEAKLDQALADGKITQEQHDRALAKAEEALPKLFDRAPDPDRQGRRQHAAQVAKGVFGSAAEAIGITPEALRDELRASGGSIASVAAAHGKTADAVIAAMTADANAHIDQAVANGQMTVEQGAKAKEQAATAIARMVTSEGRPHGHGR